MRQALVSAVTIAALTGVASAQSVDIRIVERTGQTTITQGGDAILDFAVQARVNGGPALAGFSFDIVMPGEPDSYGTLALGLISNTDGTYANNFAVGGTVGRHGLARTYTYLAGIGATFNGVINTSAGTFTNTPGNQEIGLITGIAAGTSLLSTPGIDPGGLGSPATWSGYGSGNTPNAGDTATLDPAISASYLARGQFIDIYRFRYTVNVFTCRNIVATLANLNVQTGDQFVFQNGSWQLNAATLPSGSVNLTPWVLPGCPSPGVLETVTIACTAAGVRRRRTSRSA